MNKKRVKQEMGKVKWVKQKKIELRFYPDNVRIKTQKVKLKLIACLILQLDIPQHLQSLLSYRYHPYSNLLDKLHHALQ